MKRILRHVGGKDFKKAHQRKLDEQRAQYLEKREQEIQEENERERIEEISKPFKSDWRKEINLQESDWFPVDRGIANSTVQTFALYSPDSGTERTFSGLGGVETHPSTVVVDGETLDAPTFSQLGLQGYAPPLGGVQRQTQQTENERIDAEIRKLEEQIRQLTQQQNDAADEYLATEPQYTGWSEAEYTEKSNELGQKWGDKMWPLQKALKDNPSCVEVGNCEGTKAALMRMSEQMIKELADLYNQYKNQLDAFAKAQDTHRAAYEKKDLALATQKDALKAKIAELEKQRPINQQLDAAQQAYSNLPFMGARVTQAAKAATNIAGGTFFNPSLQQIGSRGKGLGGVVKLGKHGTSTQAADAIMKGGFKPGSSSNVYGTRNIFLDPTKSGKAADQFAASSQAAADAGRGTLGRTARQRAADLASGTSGTGTVLPVAYKPGTGPRMNIPGTKIAEIGASADKATQGLRMATAYPNSAKAQQLLKTGATTAKVGAARGAARLAGRAVPFAGAAISAADAINRFSKGDVAGGLLSGLSAVPGPVGWAALGTQLGYDAAMSGDFQGGQTRRGQGSRGGDTVSRLPSQTTQLAQQAVGRGPTPNRSKRRKKGMKESTTWERTKKHLKGA